MNQSEPINISVIDPISQAIEKTKQILFNPFDWSFLNTSGMIRGFALTLGLGVILSLFTGIIVTRTLLRVGGFHELVKK